MEGLVTFILKASGPILLGGACLMFFFSHGDAHYFLREGVLLILGILVSITFLRPRR